MALLAVRIWGDPVLKKPTQKIESITPEIQELVATMFETMAVEGGVGLAANQVGKSLRICTIEVPMSDNVKQRFALINPRLIKKSKKVETLEEGCLSFPGIYGQITRFWEVTVEAEDLQGKTLTIAGQGLLARALQHEIDHLDGQVFIDRMPLVQRMLLSRQLNELAKHTRARLAGHGTPFI
jgi:peptide deformylase